MDSINFNDYYLELNSLNEIYPNKGESKKDFLNRFMDVMTAEYPNVKQRYAVANSYWERRALKESECEFSCIPVEDKLFLNDWLYDVLEAYGIYGNCYDDCSCSLCDDTYSINLGYDAPQGALVFDITDCGDNTHIDQLVVALAPEESIPNITQEKADYIIKLIDNYKRSKLKDNE